MRYEDASGTFQASGPVANDDADTLSAGQRGPATGNLITGEGTQYSSAGADSAAGGHVTAIAGKGGEDSSFSGGKLNVAGEHGRLTVDADGNYSYLANGNVENVRDRFTYTLADNQGNTDTAALIVEIGKTPAVIKANAQQIVPGPDGVVTLPPGVELSDVHVVGRNLVVDLPDGTQLIIIDGAVFVPQLSLGGVEVPATNVAALLIGQEVQPAAGELPPSSGGNFALPPPPLDPGIPLGDLIPPTELTYIPPDPQEVLDTLDRDPEIFVQPDGQPASVAAVDQVEEAGLPTRNDGEPAGSGESADGNGADNDVASETTTGTIVYDSPDGVASITLNGVAITSVGQVIGGDFGDLTITSIAPGAIGYSYTLDDNTSGDDTQDDFEVILTDDDGDVASATLTIDIIDDVPTARPDTDAIAAGQFGPVTGNVITDASAGDAGDGDTGADTVGADNASITAVSSANVPANSDNGAPFVVNGQYGVLTLNSDGSYSYVRNQGTPGGVNDVFNYTLTDGDGDTSTTTLTISIADTPPTIDVPVAGEDGTQVDERGLPTRNGEPAGSGEIADGNGTDNDDASETTSGAVNFTPGDGPATVRIDGVAVTSVGQTFNGDHGVLTITAIGASSVSYSYTLTDNTSGDATSDSFAFSVTDQDGDVASGNLVIDIVDDVPSAVNDTDLIAGGSLGPATGNVITDAAAGDAGDADNGADTVGADNAAVSGVASNNVPANVDNDPAGGFVVNGQYGVLTMQADGGYSYARNPGSPGGVEDVFTYTLTDGDGDSDTATLTISIGDAPTSIDAPDQGEAGTLVDEQGLPTRNGGEPAGTGEAADGNGADNDDASETTAGVITFNAPDAPATIRIDGVVVTGTVGQTFNGANGVLTITSFDAATGQIGYSYTLSDNTSGDATSDDFAIEITDADGDVASDTLVVQIIDDAPLAENDTDSIAAGQFGPATGNVITDAAAGDAGDADNGADNVGADNASVSQIQSVNVPANVDSTPSGGSFVVNGQYGVLTIGQDGNYSYVRNPGTPGGVQDVFTYSLTDGDGDTATATLTITIDDSPVTLDAPDQGEAGTVVDEQGLPTRNGGEPAGTGEAADGNSSDNDDTSETTSATITYTAPDGPATVTIDGVAVTFVGQTFAGAHGTLTITSMAAGSIGYSYTLADNTSGDATFDDFTVQVIDQDGDVATDTLTIDIIDDQPTATNDLDFIVGGNGPATGNVITGVDFGGGDVNGTDGSADNVGADNALVSQIQSNNVPANVDTTPTGGNFVVNGQYGVLTIGQNGNYSYLRNDGSPGGVQDVFTYTLTDGDGDIVTATLTISIDDNFPTAGNVNVQLDDETLAGGIAGGTGDADPSLVNVSGNLPGSGGDAPLTFSVLLTGEPAGFDYVSGGAGVVLIQQGGETKITVTVNPDGSYTVVQNNPVDHAPGGNENDVGPLVVNYTVSDNDNDIANGTITINVDDDTPTISASTTQPTLAVDETDLAANAGPTSFAGVFTAAFGADGQAAVNPSVYTLGINAGVTGIVDTATGQAVVLSLNGTVVEGRTSGSNELVFTVTVDGSGNVTLDQLRAVVHNDPADHDEPGLSAVTLANDNMITLTRTITDGDGDTVSATADIGRNLQFEDDGPDAVNDSANQATENTPVNIDVHANDSDGADDVILATGIQVVGGSLTGTGLLVYNGDGTFTYTPGAGEQGSVQFQYRLTDRDGDSDVATVTINLQPDSTPNAVDGAAAVDDDGLAGGNAASVTGDLNANASPPEAPTVNPSEAIFHGQLVATAGNDTIVDYDFASMHGTSGSVGTETVNYTWNNATSTLTATGPRGPLFDVVVNQATGEYTLTLRDNVLHAAGNNENDATTNLTFTVTDSDGDPDTGTIVVTFDDDAPTIGTIQNGTASNNPAALASTGALNMVIGADSPASVVAISANNTGVTSGGFNLVTNVVGNVLTAYQDVNGNGSYDALTETTAVYTLTVDPNAGASGRYTFDLITPFDPTVTETLVGGSSSFGAGPTGFQILLNPAGTQDLAVVSGYLVDTVNGADGDGVFDFNAWFGGTLSAAQIASAGTNGSVSGWGVDNNNFENENELFFFDFGAQATSDPDAGGPFVPPTQGPDVAGDPPEVQMPNISTATFEFINYSSGAGDAGDDIAYVVHYTDGSFDNGWVPDNAIDGDVQWKFIADPGKFIADIQFFSGRNPSGTVQDLPPGKIDLVSVGVQTSSLTETVGFNVTIADADGDQVSGGFTVNVADGNSPSTATSMEPLASTKGGSSSMLAAAGDEDSTLSFSAANENQRWSSNGFGNTGNTGVTSAMVAASGLAAMSMSSVNSFSQQSYDALVQNGFQQLSTQMSGRESLDSGLAAVSFGSELGGSAVNAVNLSGSSFSFDDHGFSSRGLDAMSSGDAAPAYVPSYASGEPTVANVPAFAANVPSVSMASAEMLKAVSLEGNAQHGGAVEQVLADALGGNAPTIDGVLANLPGGIAELAAIANLASPDGAGVPAWDMGMQGGFAPSHDVLFKVGAVMIHQDAVQPA